MPRHPRRREQVRIRRAADPPGLSATRQIYPARRDNVAILQCPAMRDRDATECVVSRRSVLPQLSRSVHGASGSSERDLPWRPVLALRWLRLRLGDTRRRKPANPAPPTVPIENRREHRRSASSTIWASDAASVVACRTRAVRAVCRVHRCCRSSDVLVSAHRTTRLAAALHLRPLLPPMGHADPPAVIAKRDELPPG